MTRHRTPKSSPSPPGPAVGQDEWVARHGERRVGRGGPLGTVEDRLRRVPWWVWLALFLAAFSLFPLFEQSGYVRLVAFDTVLYMLLALGLNVVVGWGGLLDLGFVAFYGIGAYTYAFLDSDQFHVHLPTIVSVPVVVCVGALIGLMVGLPSRRLSGDYLAIVTLFFLQLFQTLTTNGDSVRGHDITGGPFGILNVDPFSFFGHTLVVANSGVFAVSYLYVALAFFAVVFVALRFVNNSRTGRAWRSLREDSLAAEAMGMPVNRLKLVSLRVRCRSCGAHRHALRFADGKRVSTRVLLRAAHHRVHDGDSRRLRQPGRCGPRRAHHRAAARGSARSEQVARHLLHPARRRAGARRAEVAARRRGRGRAGRLRLRGPRDRRRDALVLDRRRARGRAGRLPGVLGRRPDAARPVGRAGHLRRRDRRRARRHPAQGHAALDRARADPLSRARSSGRT